MGLQNLKQIFAGGPAKIIIVVMIMIAPCVNTYAQIKQGDQQVYNTVERLPEFPGGGTGFMSFVKKSIRYPAEAVKQKIEGRSHVTFVVEKDGTLSNVKAIGKPQPVFDKEAVRVIAASPRWKAGTEKGKAVRVQFTVPIVFSLKS